MGSNDAITVCFYKFQYDKVAFFFQESDKRKVDKKKKETDIPGTFTTQKFILVLSIMWSSCIKFK